MKFRHDVTGVVVNVDAETAKSLPSEWKAVDKPKPRTPKK